MVSNFCPSCDLDSCDLTREQYVCQALKLLPEGGMWERDDRNLIKFYEAIASFYYDCHMKDCAAAKEANPCTAVECVDSWAEFFGVNDCVTQDPSFAICEALSSKRRLNCEAITELAAVEGYIVTECRMCDETTDELITPVACGGSNPGGSMPCPPYSQIDNSCAKKFQNLPCGESLAAQCCEGEEPAEAPEADPCDIVVNEGGCGCGSLFSIGSPAVLGEPYSPLACPFSVEIVIGPASPSGAPPALGPLNGDPGGSMPSPDCPRFEICSIEAFLPLGYTAKYVRGC